MKSTTSDDSSWASIAKRSLKTKVPKMKTDFMDSSTSSGTSSPEQKNEPKNENSPPEDKIVQPKDLSPPPQIIHISDDEDLSSIGSLFMRSKDDPNHDQLVPQLIKKKNEMTPRIRHFKKCPERENFTENKR